MAALLLSFTSTVPVSAIEGGERPVGPETFDQTAVEVVLPDEDVLPVAITAPSSIPGLVLLDGQEAAEPATILAATPATDDVVVTRSAAPTISTDAADSTGAANSTDSAALIRGQSDPTDTSDPVNPDNPSETIVSTDIEEIPAECIDSEPVVSTGLTNMGFETGDLSGWTFGLITEEICVTPADDFTTPYEGEFMARMGLSQSSSEAFQPEGPNEMSQTFIVDDPIETFVYNVFTYDYTGFDEFLYRVTVEDASGSVIASFQRGAWAQGVGLKSSGWQFAELNLSAYVGQEVTLLISAGGTLDELYNFWAYIDSAESGPPHVVAPITNATSATGSTMTDPQTGQVTIAMPGQPSDLTITSEIVCPEGSSPTSASLLLGGVPFPMTESPVGSGSYTATIPAEALESATLSIEVECDPAGLFVAPVGVVALYDPSGIISDAETGEPIEGATVVLKMVPGWLPGPGGADAKECQNDGGPWVQPAPTNLGVEVSPYGSELDGGNPAIEPDVNPFISNSDGFYGWDVAEGCWYVEVSAEGYEPQISSVVGVPPEVTTLDLELTPISDGGPDPEECQAVEVPFEQPEVWNRAGFEYSSASEVNLECDEYEIHLVSFDPNHEFGYQPDQQNERWFLQGFNSAGDVLFTTAPSPDLAEDQTINFFYAGDFDMSDVATVRARHLRGSNTIDSIHIGVALIPIM